MSPNACVVLHERDLSVVLDLTDGRLPAVVHWGARVANLSSADAAVLVRAGIVPTAPNSVDEPVRLALLPEHWTGWVGRPGISGSRTGGPGRPSSRPPRCGSPAPGPRRTVLHRRRSGPARGRRRRSGGRARADAFELLVGGLIRSQVELRNLGDAYSLHDCVLAFPVPSVGQRDPRLRRSLGQGTDPAAPAAQRRHPPAGRAQGPDRPRRGDPAAPRRPGLRLRRRRGLGRAHRLERQPHALRRTAVHRRAGDRRR